MRELINGCWGYMNLNSEELIGSVQERYDHRYSKSYEWRSFYNGWLEGRLALLREINEGRYDNTAV